MTLRSLALKYGTDKAGHHEYCEAYEFFLAPWKDKHFSMLEIGVGGEEHPDRGGQSLRMWREYFPKAQIFGMDKYDKDFKVEGVYIFQGDQTDPVILNRRISEMDAAPMLIIDDASHINPLTLKTFEICYPMLAPGGIYAIEDCHTSYWEKIYGGGDHPDTVMETFKAQCDFLNRDHSRTATRGWEDVESVHFFKEIIFIRKKL